MLKKLWKLAALCCMVSIVTLSYSCGDDDEDGGGSASTSSLVGKSFKMDESYINDDGLLEEGHTQITFTSSSTCRVRSWGYNWVWHYDGSTKERYDDTETCSYSVTGNKITLHDYPFYAFGGDMTLVSYGSYLKEGDDIYRKV